MPLRTTIEADDLVTPTAFARSLEISASTVRTWIQRSEDILGRKVEPVAYIGTYPRYDFNDLAALEGVMRRKHEKAAA